ncbi:hypothetical protein L249_2492 [Ophiocordyceps polyrhachis-furcata BCC 54312]|uniref:Pre-mRNA-processing factor 19 n=1 Tax=Ophiocordyceps polyrhachis-furcata BCC 54312 TaxID=1330021 RepID=A0A367LQL6_9HYPO|nr:hypothetical protein L249_2492 [Ophiocordyceps polyrhachis-furcata BCC 54312]
MLCSISGESPQEPVVSKKSGFTYEKRLIEQYINDHGTEPGTGQALTVQDLLPLKGSAIVRPRPPTLTSIPALLATFQNEWDALALETYNLKEQLARTREELATILYQQDAAVRVVARLTKERDEAREALSKVTVGGGPADGEEMVVDSVEALPEELAERVDETHKRLTKGRKKRPIPEGWSSADDISALETVASTSLTLSHPTCLDLEQEHAVMGDSKGEAVIYSLQAEAVERQLPIGKPITDTLWAGTKLFFATGQGDVKAYEGGKEIASASEHAGPATALSAHPSGDILASVGADKSIVFYDTGSMKRVGRVFTDNSLNRCAFHPDGHLFAAGTVSGDIKLFMTKTLEQAAVFSLGAPIQAIAFSENGFWLAATAKGQSIVTIFDLRKDGDAATAKVLETGGPVQSLAWDLTGQFLATGGTGGVTVQHHAKSSKKWSEPFRNSVSAVAVRWGPSAKKLVAIGEDGVVAVYGVKEG